MAVALTGLGFGFGGGRLIVVCHGFDGVGFGLRSEVPRLPLTFRSFF